ncbi:MAG: biotin/lipoyl-binding protein [Firmicutes bacterium]|nr:biotin/lipoyl-binding protein [Bacillota bacterium]
MENESSKKRELIKTAAIVFLIILLVLTFFSNTIRNRSLPEVSSQYVKGGTINAKIRGSGTVSANEAYEVTINQTRKVRSVLVKVGDEVNVGDVLFILEESESDELRDAQDALLQKEASYQKSLIASANESAKVNHDVKKARDEYESAKSILAIYSDKDYNTILREESEAQARLKTLENEYDRAVSEWERAKGETEYVDAVEDEDTYKSELKALKKDKESYEDEIEDLRDGKGDSYESTNRKITDKENDLSDAQNDYARDMEAYGKGYNRIRNLAGGSEAMMAALASDRDNLASKLDPDEDVDYIIESYHVIKDDKDKISDLEKDIKDLKDTKKDKDTDNSTAIKNAQRKLDRVEAGIEEKEAQLKEATAKREALEGNVKALESRKDRAKDAVDAQKMEVDKLSSAKTAAESVKTAQINLEDLLFQQSLGSADNVDIQTARTEIARDRDRLNELLENADEAEVKANVSGIIESIEATAGKNIGADTAMATINVADRGYTLKIPVTNEQAKSVKIGEPAEITDYLWGSEIKAVLDKIESDPQNPGKGKLLVFNVTGDVELNMKLNLAIGQKTAAYEALVPNSAVRSDTNGSFVYVVTAKSSPLGNRYIASRADIKVLASDDKYTAVSGVGTGDVVITASAKPIEAGMQVRLVDND